MNTQLSAKANSRELNGLAFNFISIIEKSGTTDSNLLKLNVSLKTNNDKLSVALDRKLGSDKTEHVWELETLRDNGLKSFFLTVQGCTFRLNAPVKEAGMIIYEVIKRHGRTMYILPHIEQTSKMDSLFKELEQPHLVAALQTTQTAILVEETKKANQDFLDAMDDRTDAKTKEELILVSGTRKLVRINMEKIVNYLGSIIPSDENPEFESVYTSLNQVISDTNSKIKARITRKENEKKDDKAGE